MHRTNLTPHDLALRAIAAIALTVPACSSATTSLQTAADAQSQADTGTTATDAVADALAGTDAAAADVAAATDAAATTDVALASDVASDSGIDTAGKPDCTPTPNVGECCMHLGEWCAQAFPNEADYEARSECQYGPGYDGSTGCSPWGPPAPPKFEPAAWGLA